MNFCIGKNDKRDCLTRLVHCFVLVGVALLPFVCESATGGTEPSGEGEQKWKTFEFPTSENGANFRFTSFPDLYNWNIKYPQPGWEQAMDWFLTGMKREGPAFSLNAGDIMDARWWKNKKQVRRKTRAYWGGFKERFEDKNIKLYVAPGDHEYGDDQGLKKMRLAPVYAEQFASIFDMPRNGPSHKKGLAYAFTEENLAVISVDTFEKAGDRMEMSVSGKQLQWLKKMLQKYSDKDFVIVQGHVPVIGPVKSKNSSANMLKGGRDSEFWQTMVDYGVDVYLCGEHHRITAKKKDGIWQIVHGALWGTQTDVNYLRGSVWDDKMALELFKFQVHYSGGVIGDHPHRGQENRPRQMVSISRKAEIDGPASVGKVVIKRGKKQNRTTSKTGVFAPVSVSSHRLEDLDLHSRKNWEVVEADSVSTHNNKVPAHTIDGNTETKWHTEFKNNKPDHPHYIIIDMGKTRDIGGFAYVPRQDDSTNGCITEYEFFVGSTPDDLGEPVKTGKFKGDQDIKAAEFEKSVKGRYIKFKSLDAAGHKPFACVTEIYTRKP